MVSQKACPHVVSLGTQRSLLGPICVRDSLLLGLPCEWGHRKSSLPMPLSPEYGLRHHPAWLCCPPDSLLCPRTVCSFPSSRLRH